MSRSDRVRPLRPLRGAIDWGALAPLRLRARLVAEGVFAGTHRSSRRGAGVEFGGFREYVPGDDLRWLDRRSLLRHERLVVRQFETETDRVLCLLVDASASMSFRGSRAPGAKVAFAGVVAAALARIAVASGDPVALSFIGGDDAAAPVPRSGGREQFERVVGALEAVTAAGDAKSETRLFDEAMQSLARSTRRGAVVVLLSDLLDLPPGAADRFATLATQGRVVVVVQTLDPDEQDLPYAGNVRLRALEGGAVVETDADLVRERYREALEAVTTSWRDAVVRRGGRFLQATTTDDPVDLVRSILQAVR